MPVIPEAAVALLACAKIGAVAVPAFSGYGPDPLAARLRAAGAVALVTVDGTTCRGRRVAMKDIADEALSSADSVKHLITVRHDLSEVKVQTGRDIDWSELGRGLPRVPTEPCDPNDPLMIIYTSGTTGAPRASCTAMSAISSSRRWISATPSTSRRPTRLDGSRTWAGCWAP